ncbi:MAG: Rieske 2Fe-2S domain-containing protein [Deltaproteobacteria bacterium]|nr:Rieske 2Fe-2S domain-containing protein [Deltaproteobacteria bacterium]
MLTQEENELLTQVGPGTPAGELLRRYWHPIAVAEELTEERPTKFVRVLGENLLLFRDKRGRAGLLADRCSHRGASLSYGRVEERGIACAYHGWLYDIEGNCLETPSEPPNSNFCLTVKHQAYPVQKFTGLYWTYMGPKPAPLIPRYDVWVRTGGKRKIVVYPLLDANWFQAMENSVDPAHLQILHQDTAMRARKPASTTRGFIDDIEETEFCEVSYGIMKRRRYKRGVVDEHPLIFPNILRQGDATQIRVPMDDTHTLIFFVHFIPGGNGGGDSEAEPEVLYMPPFKDPPKALHPFARFRTDLVLAQDHMVWETPGPIADRTRERLATSDRGIVMLREIMMREVRKVAQGLDPMGVIRDPAQDVMIDTKLAESLEEMKARGQPAGGQVTALTEAERALGRL